MDRIGSPKISRRDLPSGLPRAKYSSIAPGLATTSKVGFGMYSLIWPRIAIFVRPLICTYWIAPAYSLGRYLRNASSVSYRWLSASNSGYGSSRDGIERSSFTI